MLRRKEKVVLHPIMAYVVLIVITILLSFILGSIGVSTNYNMINASNGSFYTTTVAVKSILNIEGIKTIFSTTVSNFVNFAPLSMLLITLIGIGIMDKSGFLESFFALLTKKVSKFWVTFCLAFITIFASIVGDISFVILIPITALLFKYSKRNPKAGIIMAFAGLSIGSGINIFMSSVESSLFNYTELAALSIDATYAIRMSSYLIVMFILTIIMSLLVTYVTENIIIPKLGKYESEETEEFYLDKRKKRGLLFSLSVASVYLVIFIYNIIPGLPFSGKLLDDSQLYYIDKLFGYNSFFNQGFVFIITLLFFICGLFYGIGSKTIKNNQDVSSFLGHSLDNTGKMLVLLFFASAFISIFKYTEIGTVCTSFIANIISKSNFIGIPLIFLSFILICLISILLPSPVSSWAILSGVLVPVFMNAGMTPEFAELVFKGASSVIYGLTPIAAYFVVYLAFLDNYSEENKSITMSQSIKYILTYSIPAMIIWIVILILLYVTGLPIGLGVSAIL